MTTEALHNFKANVQEIVQDVLILGSVISQKEDCNQEI